MFGSDRLPTIFRFWARAKCVRQGIKTGSGFIFGTVRLFRVVFRFFLADLPARTIVIARTNVAACG